MTQQTPRPKHLQRGQTGEQLAKLYLQQQGLKLVSQNFHCKLGEIDLIMLDKKQLVFVEVRLRSSNNYGHSIETIDRRKMKKIIYSAEVYLQQQRRQDDDCRFDVVAISKTPSGNYHCQWEKAAFSADEIEE